MKPFWSIFIILLLFTLPGYALVVKRGNAIGVTKDEVIDDDLIALGREVTIQGRVNGDLYAFAQDVDISGEVEGTIFCGASKVKISSSRVSSIWAGAGDITISCFAEKNVALFGGQLLITKDAEIKKDLRCYGGDVNVQGYVNGVIKGSSGRFRMSGQSRTINIKADDVHIDKSARIDGDLIVRGNKAPTIESGAEITGTQKLVNKSTKEKGKGLKELIPVLGFFTSLFKTIAFIAQILVGIVLIALSKNFPRRVMDTLIAKPWVSLGWGFLGVVVIPVAVIILFVVLIGFPFAIFGIYFYTVLLYLASIFIAFILGERIIQLFKKEGEVSLYLSFIVGIITLFILGLIPVLGFIIKIAVILFGSGSLLLAGRALCQEMRGQNLI